MRQPALIETFIPSPDAQVPHPVLRAVLDNLDVNLEEELIRYRRQQRLQSEPYGRHKAVAQPRSLSRTPARAPQNGIQLPNVRDALNLHPTGEFPIGNSAASQNPVKAILGNASESVSRTVEPAPAIAPLAEPDWVQPATPPQMPDEGIASYAQHLELSVHEPNAALQKLIQDNAKQRQANPDHISHGNLSTQRLEVPRDYPEDYLESSEELLKSIQEETSSQRAQRRPDLLDTLLTPMGIGSMVLLLLSSTTLGYLIMNPAALSGFLTPQTANSPTAPSPLTRVPTTPIDVFPSPNLAAEEFKDLNLDTLSTIPSNARRSPAPTQPKTAASPQPANRNAGATAPARSQPQVSVAPVPQELPAIAVESAPPVAASAPVAPPSVEPLPPARATAPAAEPAPPKAASPEIAVRPSAAPENLYYVGTEYSSDSSLQQARQSVPDAYVRNLPSGAKVQLGAFSSEAAAQERVQELQQQGIPAQVYQP
ncbi:MAG: SPOR domain-containing protein [Oscillatoriophycideae cyanobacterium NC_groundwater_1537_Pr4_S-0.65um_50_18]|nr:SPOR domain-containing protein [Oscillatoriophycideae cyanobacterium NC_groundwater_1537_Pr4_S-0.65um_50_18]